MLVKQKANFDLNYSIISLWHLDILLVQMFGQGMTQLHSREDSSFSKGKDAFFHELETLIGCYYGECIRRAYLGKWAKEAEKGLHLINIANTDIAIFPFSTAKDRINGDDSKLFRTSSSLNGMIYEALAKKFEDFEKEWQQNSAGATPPPLPS